MIIWLRSVLAGRRSSDAMGACLPDQVKTHPLFRIGCAEKGEILPVRVPEVVKTIYEGENETYIEASAENSGSILYDKEIRDKPRTRRTKRNV